jgi:hypothetical protein
MQHFERFARRRSFAEEGIFDGAENQGEWSPELVADVAEECSLGAIEIG